jgi:hypothetical protein
MGTGNSDAVLGVSPSDYPLTHRLLEELHEEFPKFAVVDKRQSSLATWIHWALLALTLGKQNRFISDYHTVIGDTLLVCDHWQQMADRDRVILLRHERVHLRQRRRWTFGGMAFIYLLPWFPIGLAYGRARLEWEAYVETLRATAELYGLEAAQSRSLRSHIIDRFTGPDYVWMWPFPKQLQNWYDAALTHIEAEMAATRPDYPAPPRTL